MTRRVLADVTRKNHHYIQYSQVRPLTQLYFDIPYIAISLSDKLLNMKFGVRNAYYLRISSNTVLPLYVS